MESRLIVSHQQSKGRFQAEWQNESGQLETGQVVCAALCSELIGDNSEGFVELLNEICAVEKARPMLARFRASESEPIAKWASRVLAQVE
jgi:hypothetical protein